MNKSKKNKKNDTSLSLKIVVILFILLMIFLIFNKIKTDREEALLVSARTSELFDMVNKNYNVNITKYIVYGTHLNFEGTLALPNISGISIDKSDVIIRDLKGNEITLNSDYSYIDGILSFSTIDKLNSGLYLEDLSVSDYYIFLKVSFSNSDVKYYSLSNDTKYNDITYYTITRDNSNNKIDIKFDKYNDISYMGISVSKASHLPDNVYDIVIDPGHGGSDSGAKSNGYHESNIVLDCAKTLKSKLESFGLKVLLTRDGSEASTQDTVYNIYDDGGRVNISNESHAKILISLHLNSNTQNVKQGGVEVYAPSNCNLDLAKLFADNIVKFANTSYSKLNIYKKDEGVYVQNFTNADILAFKAKAKEKGYEPYNLTTDTPYLYMIREIGGICTNAFVDGRNTSYAANKYIDSNVGIEGYLIELGYMIVDKDLKNVVSNGDSYMQGIANSIKSFYKLK
ncbi:MAG: N-acetylmuramoyl-L-alanine amidase [Clostridia bacterium]|nr:N-acetylmuramoyl-L-alanine amidase [Clostridia bacterium]